MLIVISPAKKLDFSSNYTEFNQRDELFFASETADLLGILQNKNIEELKSLMSISDSLAKVNFERYQNYSKYKSKPCLLAFKGDVYSKIDVGNYGGKEFSFAQKHLYILSGLYGLLRSLDLIKPYRLEMGTKMAIGSISDLYQFWRNKITNKLKTIMEKNDQKELINLASSEYSSAIDFTKLGHKTVNIVFKNKSKDQYKVVGILAKRARGMMVDFIIKNKITLSSDLKEFSQNGYFFDASLSDEKQYIFLCH